MFFPELPPPDTLRLSAEDVRIWPGNDPKGYIERLNDVLEGLARIASTAGDSVPKRFNDIRQAIIDGLVSSDSEAAGWNALRSKIPVSAVVRTSDTVVTITLPPLPGYNISAPESITATIPGFALVSGKAITATPSILVRPVAGQ